MSEEKFRILAATIVAGLALAAITVLLIAGIPVEVIGTAFLILTSLVTVFLYNEMRQVKENTNGRIKEMQSRLDDLTEYAKHSLPVDKIRGNNGSV